ncbi:diacylglycerol/lipid kinase family protein [Propionibacterium cyclohexanicum]|nr:diacylglycerol kinase family protein [Propionibacterium cyclohexanicum]
MTRNSVLADVRLPATRRRPTLADPRRADSPRCVGLIMHSLASRPGRIVSMAQDIAAQLHARLLVEFTSLADPGHLQAVRLIERGADLVVVAGGDGTIRQVLPELLGSPIPLGIIPVGSGNVLAAALGLAPGSLADQVGAAIAGRLLDIDVGEVVCTEDTGRTTGPALFCCMAGIGRDAETVRATSRTLKKLLGPAAYGVVGLGQVLRRPRPMSWRVDTDHWQTGRHWTVLATNTPLVPGAHIVPGGVLLAEQARMDDGLLDVVAVAPQRPDEWAGIAVKGLFGSPARVPGLDYAQGPTIQVHSPEPVAVQADGDIVSARCVDFRARIAGRIRLRVA